MDTTAVTRPAITSPKGSEPIKLRKRIGSTVFIVSVHFSEMDTERPEDKLLRMMKREVEESA